MSAEVYRLPPPKDFRPPACLVIATLSALSWGMVLGVGWSVCVFAQVVQ